MGIEIERKFLVQSEAWRARVTQRTLLRQGYLSSEASRIVRVRIAGEQAFLTIKGLTRGISRAEWEYPIPMQDAQAMLEMCERPLIEKYRSLLHDGEICWEIDEFLGENAGLVLAEVELQSAEQSFTKPDWLGKEVSGDLRFSNSNLGKLPFSKWQTV